ncbi:flagellar hook-length control protein FliK [Acanthopleuribacter pedis]|uniref:Flagellar hook-length control protein FliK n=1 Tax=Acanthopleuribacter pedis TaxID=442870 RepID=A0A8J7QBL2_9BACT|nr:flagellar hook-length control protein FliK [Acanthopleuribacter pedis]MBO1323137.1 flagellar hook-length control protein FliK [Acanthopleuribacter pedis]
MAIPSAPWPERRAIKLEPGRDSQVQVQRGNAGYGVRVGERLVGFAGEPVQSVALSFDSGAMQIELQAAGGQSLGSVQVPNAAALKQNSELLREHGVVFGADDQEQLANLMQLSLNAGVSRGDMVLLLDEITHRAPEIQAPQTINIDSLYPELKMKVEQLVGAMPEEIQRFVLLSNRDAMPDADWQALQLVNKVDPRLDPALYRFLSGEGALDNRALLELPKVAAREPMAPPPLNAQLRLSAFLQLRDLLTTLEPPLQVAGGPAWVRFTPDLVSHFLKNLDLTIPNFAAAESFDELERLFWLDQSQAGPSEKRSPLALKLLQNLDVGSFRRLGAFLTGQPGAVFNGETRAELDFFLKNMPDQAAANRLSTLDPKALARVEHHLRNHAPQALAAMEAAQSQQKATALLAPQNAQRLQQMLDAFAGRSAADQTAFFVLDRLDPVKQAGLFDFFNGDHRLAKMTPSLERDLDAFLKAGDFPRVSQGLAQLKAERFAALSDYLAQHHAGLKPEGFFPGNGVLRAALLPNAAEALSPADADYAARRAHFKEMEPLLRGAPAEALDRELTKLLRGQLIDFKRIAMIDQAWQAEALTLSMIDGGSIEPNGLNQLVDRLKTMRYLLTQDRRQPLENIQWDLWRRPEVHLSGGGEVPLETRVRGEESGFSRYLWLDRHLAEAGTGEVPLFDENERVARIDRFLNSLRLSGGGERLLPVLQHNRALLQELATVGTQEPALMVEPLTAAVNGMEAEQANQRIDRFLKQHLSKYTRVAMLDQTWELSRLADAAAAGKMAPGDAAGAMARGLRDLIGVLQQDGEKAPGWRLWQREPEPVKGEQDPRPRLQDRLIREEKGLFRYLAMDHYLPDRDESLAERLREMGWMRRLERLSEQLARLRDGDLGSLNKLLGKNKALLAELVRSALEGETHDWNFRTKSPLNGLKARQFETFREQILQGQKPDPGNLFQGPFLRSEFGERAEELQARAMKNIEPKFREALSRLDVNQQEALARLAQMAGSDAGDVAARLSQTLELVRDFNQMQNLNESPMYLNLPLRFGDQDSEMELAFMRLPGRRAKHQFLVILHLDFPVYGHLRVDALKDRNQLFATFWVETPRMHHRILADLHVLEDQLEALGMGETELTVKVGPERATRSVAEMISEDDDSRLDLSI